jgi:MFS family permease
MQQDDPPAMGTVRDARVGEEAAAAEALPGSPRRTVVLLSGLLLYQGYAMSINAIAAPWIARSFELSQSGIAALYACISVSAIGALLLSRLIDRVGRRRVLLWCMTATPLCALGAALSTSIPLFVLFEIFMYAFIGATVSASVVMFAEALPIEQRAKGQSFGGLALGLGAGVCVILMPVLSGANWSWRWLLALAATGLVALPFVARAIPESERWQRAAAEGRTRSRFGDLFGPAYRRRAVPLLVCVLLSQMAGAAATNWSYYHSVSEVGLSAATTSMIVLIAGGLSLLGYPLGARLCESFGRVRTVVAFGLFITGGALFYYWGPPAGFRHPALWLGTGFLWFTLAGNGAMVGANSAATELFPTPLRATVIGWFALAGAISHVSAQTIIAVLADPLGGLSNVVGYLACLATPSALLFGLFIEETRGLALEVAARETVT